MNTTNILLISLVLFYAADRIGKRKERGLVLSLIHIATYSASVSLCVAAIVASLMRW